MRKRISRPTAPVVSATAAVTAAQVLEMVAVMAGHPLPPGGGAALTSLFALLGGMLHRDGRK